jgi:hypothetical protein
MTKEKEEEEEEGKGDNGICLCTYLRIESIGGIRSECTWYACWFEVMVSSKKNDSAIEVQITKVGNTL